MIRKLSQRILPWIARIGCDAHDSHEQRLQKTLLSLGSFMFTAAGVLWGMLYFLLGEYVAASIPLGYTIISMLGILMFHWTRHYKFLLFSQLLLILFLRFLLMIELGGFIRSSAVILWSLLSRLGALPFGELRQGIRWLAVYLSLTILSGYFEFRPWVSPSSLSPATIIIFFVLNIGTVSAIAIILLAYFVSQKNLLSSSLKQRLGF